MKFQRCGGVYALLRAEMGAGWPNQQQLVGIQTNLA
jgi:hypothetical protein